MSIKELKVSFIDKDTMCAVDPSCVEIYINVINDGISSTLSAYYWDEDGTEKEVEIKVL